MRSESTIWIGTGVLVAIFGALIGFGASGATVVFIAVIASVMLVFIASSMASPFDASWLPRWVAIGFIAKLAGTAARYYMVTVFYGLGDSYRYYRAGTELAVQWRNGHIPRLTGSGSLGTQIVEWFTGALFAVITPDMLGGFVLFAVVAFLGQLLLYAAFRRFARPHQLKPYAILIFLLPTYAFWPSSIGKDALILFTLGASSYCVARVLESFHLRWLVLLGVSLVGVGLVRIHIAGLLVAAFAITALIARIPTGGDQSIALRRFLTLGAGVAAAALVVAIFPDIFGVDILSSQDRDFFTADVIRRTSESGTVDAAEPATSPLNIPGALVHVLFRPFAFEATELQHFFAAIETGFLALLTLWRLPAIIRNLGKWRSNPYLVFCTFYTLGFAVAFSVVRNLGIIARQRGQVVAFFLCIVVALGWPEPKADNNERSAAPALADR